MNYIMLFFPHCFTPVTVRFKGLKVVIFKENEITDFCIGTASFHFEKLIVFPLEKLNIGRVSVLLTRKAGLDFEDCFG